MKIIIDADACPVVDIAVGIAKKRNLKCILVCDNSHFIKKDGSEELLNVGTLDKAYKVRENAYKALQHHKKEYYLSDGYKPTRSEFSVVKEPALGLDNKYVCDFIIKEHWLSDFEKES